MEKCCVQVSDNGRWSRLHQCTRAAVVERGGKHYCKQHDPVESRKRLDANYAKHRAKMDRVMRPYTLAQHFIPLLTACKAALAYAEHGEVMRLDDLQVLRKVIKEAEAVK